MFIDADVHFDPEAVVRLIKSGHDIQCSMLPKESCDVGSSSKCCKEGDERDMSMLSSSLVINFGAQESPVKMDLLKFWMDQRVSCD